VQALDQRLLALDAPQRQVAVTRLRGQADALVHDDSVEGEVGLEGDTGVSASVPSVADMNTETVNQSVSDFFDRYATTLLARDEKTISRLYAVPALILFPGNPVPVSDASQTEAFFASAWEQYDGVSAVEKQVEILAEGPGTVWADVTWSYDGEPRERMCYQLVDGADGWQIAVLTPLAVLAPLE